MFADENETNVDSGATSQEPAKTAEIESAGAPAASSPGLAIGAPQETAVSYPDHHHDVAQVDGLQARVVAIVREQSIVEIEAAVSRELDARIENVKAELLANLKSIIFAIAEANKATPAVQENPSTVSASAVHVLAVGDPVRVYKDADRKTFYTGTVTALHEGGHAADVSINELEGGALTTARLDSLEYDDRA